MRALIVDDESAARSRLARLLGAFPDIVVAGEACDGLEAVGKIGELTPDIIFLDIEMPGLTGFEVLRSLPESAAMPLIVFVTGFDQHALAAFEANALAYLLKPIEPERLATAIERARRLTSAAEERESERTRVQQAIRESPRILKQLVCHKRDRAVLIAAEHILWFEVEGGLVRARTPSESYWVNHQLNELEAALPRDLFFRARREVLVNVNRIREIKPYFKSGFLLIMADAASTEIVVSERQVKLFRQRLPGL